MAARQPEWSVAMQKAEDDGEQRSGGADRAIADDALTWSALMARAQEGDGLAYRRLLEEVTPYLRSLAARHGGLSGETEDTVQDILLTLHAARQTYDARRPFGPWLLAIARRRIADRLRRLGRRAAAETPLACRFPSRESLEDALRRFRPGPDEAIGRLVRVDEP